MSGINFSTLVTAVAESDRNPWSVQVDVERESGMYRHPVTDEPISLGGAVYIARRGKAGSTDIGEGVTFRQGIAALLKANGTTLAGFRSLSLKAKAELHAAIAAKHGTAAAKKAAKAAVASL